jgi:hypothetical protein
MHSDQPQLPDDRFDWTPLRPADSPDQRDVP